LFKGDVIEVAWSDQKLEKACTEERAGKRRFAGNWKHLQKRLAFLLHAPTLKDMDTLPGNCHALSGDRAGEFAVHLWGSYRLIFSPNHDPLSRLPDGGIDTAHVSSIVIREVVDYHGR
jgi:proteic killer suppression protein